MREVSNALEQVSGRFTYEVRPPVLVAWVRLHDPVVRAYQALASPLATASHERASSGK